MGFFGLIVCALYSISISKLHPFRMEAFISFLRDMIRRYAPTLFQDWAPVVDAEHPEEWIKGNSIALIARIIFHRKYMRCHQLRWCIFP